MNNLLRTLSTSHVQQDLDGDLRLLLSTVKEGRKQNSDPKLTDAFYESLEGLLVDLRSVTMDNRDAEAFLRPVSKTDVPDYTDYIEHPMDFQTMMKKVKQRQYKSKRDFTDDLDLIWSNCFTYNAAEGHPLRLCATRLKAKAEKLLANITDRRERMEPILPDLHRTSNGARPKVNGISSNGHAKTRSPLVTLKLPATACRPSAPTAVIKKPDSQRPEFEDTPAITRTPSGMREFWRLDQEVYPYFEGPASPPQRLVHELANYGPESNVDSDDETLTSATTDGEIGEKRRINGITDLPPRKRPRLAPHPLAEGQDISDLWWQAVQSDSLLGNGLPPTISYLDSRQPASAPPRPRTKSRKLPKTNAQAPSKSLLSLMNSNIRTMRRVRRTHAKFAALNQTANQNQDDPGSPIDGPDLVARGDDVDDRINERPWKVPKGASGVDIGSKQATECLTWAGRKILEHAGFQGTSEVALDVLAGVTSEYLLNVGRTMRFLCDKYAQKMTPEEIILHALFESGTSKIQDLERYIKDDVIRHGSRLADLEKKLVGAYENLTTVEVPDDGDPFGDQEDEEEDGAYVMGGFAEAFGEDFLGLRELGIASEFGLTSLSVPKKLLKGKNKGKENIPSAIAKPTEPPPPYPPPPPFAPLVSAKVDDQIGLLRPYYHDRFTALASSDPFLPDDHPNPSQIKIGPLGQIVKPGPPAGAGKKKGKGKELTAAAAEGEKKAGGSGGTVGRPPGSGAGKKKAKAAAAPGLGVIMPPVVFASQ